MTTSIITQDMLTTNSCEIAELISGNPQVFGWIYAVVFETSVVKVGMSKASPQCRIAAHRHAGAKFGVKISHIFIVEIFTKNTAELESALIKKANSVAELISGREWFQFKSISLAAEFCESQVLPLKMQSYLDRPSMDQLNREERRSRVLLKAAFIFANITNDEKAHFDAGCEFARCLQELAQDSFYSSSFFLPLPDFPRQSLFTLICGAYVAGITERERIELFEVLDAAIDEDNFQPYFDFFDRSRVYLLNHEVAA